MSRVKVLKTYKLYIGGKFPRTESGRYYTPEVKGNSLGNICLSSRKDFRNAVVAARKAQTAWQNRSAYNKSQIIYRIAEILEDRKEQFIEELMRQGSGRKSATKEVESSIDTIIYYAGWCDKYQQVFSSVNPVASSHFNFSVYEPQGVISSMAAESSGLSGLVQAIIPALCGGNTVVALASESKPLSAITFAEVLNASDVPAGTVNILTGKRKELIDHIGTHMDVDGVYYHGDSEKDRKLLREHAALNFKRIQLHEKNSEKSPYDILEFQEVKTTWHPIEKIGETGSGY